MPHYDFIHIICCYPGHGDGRFFGALKGQFLFLEHYRYLDKCKLPEPAYAPYHSNTMSPAKQVLCIVSVRGLGDSHIKNKRVRADAVSAIQDTWNAYVTKPNLHLQINQGTNWGGTIGALYDEYLYVKNANITTNYMAVCEDDWIANNWPIRERLVEDNNVGYIGMQQVCNDRTDLTFLRDGYRWVRNYDRKFLCDEYLELKYQFKSTPNNYVWTDGGYYFFKWDTLVEIENKIGAFTKAPRDEAYTWGGHGVEWGEAGFPTELALNNWLPVVLDPGTCIAAQQFADGFQPGAYLPLDFFSRFILF